MDNFDDLISHSSRTLEDNPFANPFAQQRPGSPDPWSTFGQQAHTTGFQDEHFDSSHFGNAFETHDQIHEKGEHKEPEDSGEQSDVNDSPLVENLHVEPQTDPFSETPGFLESTPSSAEETGDIPNPAVDEIHERNGTTQSAGDDSTPINSPLKTVQTPLPEEPLEHRATSSISAPLPTFGSSTLNSFTSPLDSTTANFTQSFASLALGGESVSEWQNSSNVFASAVETRSDEKGGYVEEQEKDNYHGYDLADQWVSSIG